jgi:hypothetical protein
VGKAKRRAGAAFWRAKQETTAAKMLPLSFLVF